MYIEALNARQKSLADGDFEKYCASTFALSEDLTQVVDSIPWMRWGSMIGDFELRATAVLVAAAKLPKEETRGYVSTFAPGKEDEVIQEAIRKGLIIEGEDYYMAGPKCPKPYAED